MILSISAYNQFLISLSPSIHPAVKGHLTELFKSLVTLPAHLYPEKYPDITPEAIQAKLNILSEEAGVSFSLILVPPTSQCLKVINSRFIDPIYKIFWLQCSQRLRPQMGRATNVMVFELGGPKIATKYRYRYCSRDIPPHENLISFSTPPQEVLIVSWFSLSAKTHP